MKRRINTPLTKGVAKVPLRPGQAATCKSTGKAQKTDGQAVIQKEEKSPH